MGGYIMRWSFHRLRIRSLQILSRVVKPSLPLSTYLTPTLGFDGMQEAARFIVSCGGNLVEEVGVERQGGGGVEFSLDCKASTIEMVREVTEEEVSFKGAAFADYLKSAVLAGSV